MRMRIGDGRSVKIWEDRWNLFKDGEMSSPKPLNCSITHVHHLIKQTTNAGGGISCRNYSAGRKWRASPEDSN